MGYNTPLAAIEVGRDEEFIDRMGRLLGRGLAYWKVGECSPKEAGGTKGEG